MSPSIIAAGIGLGSNLLTNLFNKSQTDASNEIIKQNNQFQQEQYLDEKQYKRDLQERLFQREDNSYQRTIEDITRSGLSPLAINGTNNAGNVVSSAQPPELQQINPFQAQNMDFGQLIDAIQSEDYRKLEEEKLEFEKQKHQSDTEFRAGQAEEQVRQFNESIQQQANQFEQQAKQNQAVNENTQKQIDLLTKQTDTQVKLAKLQESKAKNEAIIETVKTYGGSVNWFKPSEKEKFEQANATWYAGLDSAWKEALQVLNEKTSQSESKAKSKSGGLNADIMGTPIKGGINAGWSDSENKSYSQDTYNKAMGIIKSYYQKNPKPLMWFE